MYFIIYTINFSLSVLCMGYMAFRDYKKIDRTHWSLIISILFINLGYMWTAIARTPGEALLANDLLQLDGSILPLFFLLSLFSAFKIKVPKHARTIGYLLAVSQWFMMWVFSRNGLYFETVAVRTDRYGNSFQTTAGPYLWIHYAYIALMFTEMNAVIIYNHYTRTRELSGMGKCFCAVIGTIVVSFILQLLINPEFQFLPLVYTLCGWLVAFSYERSRLYDIEDIASMKHEQSDAVHGYLAFDRNRHFLGATQKAEELIPELVNLRINSQLSVDTIGIKLFSVLEGIMNGIDFDESDQRNYLVGDSSYLLSASYFSLSNTGVNTGYLIEVTDDTERQKHIGEIERYNKELKIKTEQANLASKAKGMFLANMSHEIRTPINAVLGLDTMILRESNEPQIIEYALDIENASNTLLTIINEILDLSKIESGKMELSPVEYELSSLINDVRMMILPRAIIKDLAIHIEVDENLPRRLYGDDIRIRQILVNLMNNAVKYTEQGSVTLSVKGKMAASEIRLFVAVEDTGVGIKEQDIEKLYARFERINEEGNRNVEGTGLGMSIAMQLLDLMDGKLTVESEYGKGSVFSFSIKQQIIDDEPIGKIESHADLTKRNHKHELQFCAPDAKLLIVDDNAMNRKVFAQLLKGMQLQITEAGGGVEGLEKIESEKYDLIFLDHMMPDMDGIEVMKSLQCKRTYINQNTPKIILTANAVVGAKEKYMAEGFDGYLSKPINADHLEAMIAKFLPDELKKEVVKTEKKVQRKQIDMSVFPEVTDVEWEYAMLKLKDASIVLSVAKDFSMLAKADLRELSGQFEGILQTKGEAQTEAYQQYRVKVHAMKNSAAMFGANTVAALARVLEYAAREQDYERITQMHPVLANEWMALKNRLDLALGLSKKEEVDLGLPEISKSLLSQFLQSLGKAIADVDLDTADAVVEELGKYQLPKLSENWLENLAVAVRNIDEESVKALIQEAIGE